MLQFLDSHFLRGFGGGKLFVTKLPEVEDRRAGFFAAFFFEAPALAFFLAAIVLTLFRRGRSRHGIQNFMALRGYMRRVVALVNVRGRTRSVLCILRPMSWPGIVTSFLPTILRGHRVPSSYSKAIMLRLDNVVGVTSWMAPLPESTSPPQIPIPSARQGSW
jgi:hypothetical protein